VNAKYVIKTIEENLRGDNLLATSVRGKQCILRGSTKDGKLIKKLNKYHYENVDHKELPVFHIRCRITKKGIKKS